MGIGLIYKQLIAMCIALFYPKISNKFYATLFLSGCVLDNIFLGTFIFERISNYLVYTNIMVFPYFFKSVCSQRIRFLVVYIILIYFSVESFTGLEKHGAVPYRTILNEDLENPPAEYYENN